MLTLEDNFGDPPEAVRAVRAHEKFTTEAIIAHDTLSSHMLNTRKRNNSQGRPPSRIKSQTGKVQIRPIWRHTAEFREESEEEEERLEPSRPFVKQDEDISDESITSDVDSVDETDVNATHVDHTQHQDHGGHTISEASEDDASHVDITDAEYHSNSETVTPPPRVPIPVLKASVNYEPPGGNGIPHDGTPRLMKLAGAPVAPKLGLWQSYSATPRAAMQGRSGSSRS